MEEDSMALLCLDDRHEVTWAELAFLFLIFALGQRRRSTTPAGIDTHFPFQLGSLVQDLG
jgi:hypothetical protein